MRWEAAMARFVDRTGRAGPATWEAGDYPSGREDYPVSGLSWYEAAAYARFRGDGAPHHLPLVQGIGNAGECLGSAAQQFRPARGQRAPARTPG